MNMGVTDTFKDGIRGLGSVGLGMLGAYGLLGIVGGDAILGIVLIAVAVGGIVTINGVVDTPLDMT
jgi:hypothetical protein